MSFCFSHLRIRGLGEFTVGTDLHRSDSLALVQLLIPLPRGHGPAALAIGGSPPWPTRASPRERIQRYVDLAYTLWARHGRDLTQLDAFLTPSCGADRSRRRLGELA